MDQKEAHNRSSALPYAAPKFLEGIVKKKKKEGMGCVVIAYVPKAGQISSTNVDTERRLCTVTST